jgi:hypothetical protein
MQSNREKNQAYDTRAQARVRPAPKHYDFEPLQTIMDGWRSDPAVTHTQGEAYE